MRYVTHTHTGKRVVKVSITLSYGLIPLGVPLGKSPDTFLAALHKTWEFLIVGFNKLLSQNIKNAQTQQQSQRVQKMLCQH